MFGIIATILFVVGGVISAYALMVPMTTNLYGVLWTVVLVLGLLGGALIVYSGVTGKD